MRGECRLHLLDLSKAFDSLPRTLPDIGLPQQGPLYTEYICYYYPITGDMDLTAVQNDVDLIYDWVRVRNLRLNMGKTKSMLISSKKDLPVLRLRANGMPGQVVQTLGNHHHHLRLADHINAT